MAASNSSTISLADILAELVAIREAHEISDESTGTSLTAIRNTLAENSAKLTALGDRVDQLAENMRLGSNPPSPFPQPPFPQPPPSRRPSALKQPPSIGMIEITSRAIKLGNTKDGKISLNGTAVFSVFLQLAALEHTYAGALEAVVDLLITTFVGFANGVAPLDWTKLLKDQTLNPTSRYAVTNATSQRSYIKALLGPVAAAPGSNGAIDIFDPAAKERVSEIQKALSKVFAGSTDNPIFNNAREWIGALFQRTEQMPGIQYSTTPSKTGTKIILGQSYLWRAFHARLSSDVAGELNFSVYNVSDPVPKIVLPTLPQAPGVQFTGQMPIDIPTLGGNNSV